MTEDHEGQRRTTEDDGGRRKTTEDNGKRRRTTEDEGGQRKQRRRRINLHFLMQACVSVGTKAVRESIRS